MLRRRDRQMFWLLTERELLTDERPPRQEAQRKREVIEMSILLP
jgi:hypothetical protein